MIIYKTLEEIEYIRENCLMVCNTLSLVASELKPGVTGAYLDSKAEEFIRDNDAVPGFKGYRSFPATLCISKNDEVVHGIPDNYEFQHGDIVSIDCGVYKNQFFGDAAYTFVIGDVSEEVMKLLVTTKESLHLGIEEARLGNRLGDISAGIQKHCEAQGYGVVRELVGHGLVETYMNHLKYPIMGREEEVQSCKKV